MAIDNSHDQAPNPFMRIDLSGIETPISCARRFYLIHLLRCKIADATEVASVGDSNAARMAVRLVSLPG